MKRIYEPVAYDTTRPVGSWWEESGVDRPSCPVAQGEFATNVAIIGAGYTGLNAALQLKEIHGIDCIVLDAAQPGWGASGRNGGFACLGGAKLGLNTQIRRFGLKSTQKFYELKHLAIEQVRDNLKRYKIDVDPVAGGEVCLAHDASRYPALLKEARRNRELFEMDYEELPPEALREQGLAGPEFFGGVRTMAGFGLNPLKYVTGLSRVAQIQGVRIFGDTPVLKISRDIVGFVLSTPEARIRAKKIIVATNGYSSEDIPETLGGRYLPVLSSILVTRPLSQAEQEAQGWTSDQIAYDSRNLLHYFRKLPDNRFLFGQRGATSADPAAIEANRQQSRADFERMFPAWAHVETPWSWNGLICMTRRLLPFVGQLEGSPGVYAALGYHGNGVSLGSLSGRLVADMVAGAKLDLPLQMTRPLARYPGAKWRRGMLKLAFRGYQIADGWPPEFLKRKGMQPDVAEGEKAPSE